MKPQTRPASRESGADASRTLESQRTRFACRPIVRLATMAFVCGVFFRVWGLGTKLYTNDEATTSVHVSGHTIEDYLKIAGTGTMTSAALALRYQGIDPATSWRDVVRSLAVEDPQHPPLFYVLERCWEAVAGASVPARRSLPALFGILALPAAYAFGVELLGRRFGMLLASCVAVSPFHLLYAQQAREYSLWTLFVLVSSAVLLRALRTQKTAGLWIAFCLLTAGGLYTDVLYLYTLLAQTIYVSVAYRRDLGRRVLPFAAAAGIAVASFAPWLQILIQHAATVTNNAYLAAPVPAAALALKWLFNVGAVFFDLDYVWHPSAVVVLPILALAAFGCVALVRREPRAAGYVLALGLVTAGAFIVPDLIAHESRSTAARYLIPTWLALETVVAFGVWILLASTQKTSRAAAVATYAALLLSGIGSAAVSSTRAVWWGDGSVAPIGPIAHIVGAARRPVTVIVRDDQPIWNFAPMELVNEVPPQTRLELLTGHELPTASSTRGVTFVLDPSMALRVAMTAQGAFLREVYVQPALADDLRSLRRQTALARARVGFADSPSSLWLVSRKRR